MRRALGTPILGLALLFGGCPNRQTTPTIVYVPAAAQAPPPAPASTAANQTLVIEEPAPPPPEPTKVATPQPETAQPKPAQGRRRKVPRTDSATTGTTEADTGTETADEPPTVEVPPLEPRESVQQESDQRHEVEGLQQALRQRIANLGGKKLSNGQRKALDDAQTFLAQSGRALEEGDLQRSLNLARKASLLVTALEQGQ